MAVPFCVFISAVLGIPKSETKVPILSFVSLLQFVDKTKQLQVMIARSLI